MSMSHKDCTHPSTSKDRAKCRRSRETGEEFDVITKKKPAPSPRGKGQRRKQLEAEIAANAKRTAEEIYASRLLRGDLPCHVCGRKATWHDGQTGEPACSEHVTFPGTSPETIARLAELKEAMK
jgi:hypothetical protein